MPSGKAPYPKKKAAAAPKKVASKPGIKITVKNRKTGKSTGEQNPLIKGETGALWTTKKGKPTGSAKVEGTRQAKQITKALELGATAYAQRQRGKK